MGDSKSDKACSIEATLSPLICGLPDDIALSCLARVPREYHSVLKCVSKKWRDLVCSEGWCNYRRKNNLDETWFYALCRDGTGPLCCYVLDPKSSRRCWKLVKDLPSRCLRRNGVSFQVLGNKIYLMGGCGWSEDATDEVYCYHASRNTWTEAISMSTARCYFSCEAFNEKIYAIGGLGSETSDPHSWDMYDPQTCSCESRLDPMIISEVDYSVVIDGKIYVRCSTDPATSPVHAIVYEPSNGTWHHVDGEMVSGWRGPAVCVNGNLYQLEQSSGGGRLMVWRKEIKRWVPLWRYPSPLAEPPCQLVVTDRSLIIVGKRLGTIIYDLNDVQFPERVRLSSSLPPLDSVDDVICCKPLAL